MENKTNNQSRVVDIANLEYFNPFDGLKAKLVHTDTQTFAFWKIDKDSVLPRHHHIHEQVAIVTKGILDLTIGEVTHRMSAGMVAVIPSNVAHEAVAITDVEITDVFKPVREDFPKNEH